MTNHLTDEERLWAPRVTWLTTAGPGRVPGMLSPTPPPHTPRQMEGLPGGALGTAEQDLEVCVGPGEASGGKTLGLLVPVEAFL